MLNYQTILSNYDDKVTLMQWLKKVEAALNDASATSFKVNKKGNATISFSVVFADGSELESGDIVLQQGESVQSAAIVNGDLILTLTNGDELNAGNLGAVSGFSIDGSQHLIVSYQDGSTQDLGAIFIGNVNIAGNLTADSIIENMTGYSYSTRSPANPTLTYKYVSASKTGNKATFVIFMELAVGETQIAANTVVYLGTFVVPSAIANKLIPYEQGPYANVLATSECHLFDAATLNTYKDCVIYVTKQNTNSPGFMIYPKSALEANHTYLLRYEVTFLLNNSLV